MNGAGRVKALSDPFRVVHTHTHYTGDTIKQPMKGPATIEGRRARTARRRGVNQQSSFNGAWNGRVQRRFGNEWFIYKQIALAVRIIVCLSEMSVGRVILVRHRTSLTSTSDRALNVNRQQTEARCNVNPAGPTVRSYTPRLAERESKQGFTFKRTNLYLKVKFVLVNPLCH